MKTRKWPIPFLLAAIAVFFFSSCQEWGGFDPPAGNQVYPTLQLLGNYGFDSLEEIDFELLSYEGGKTPESVMDEVHGLVLGLDGGYARFTNQLLNANLQLGGSYTFWVKFSEENETGTLFSIANEDNSKSFSFAANGAVTFKSPEGSFNSTETFSLAANEWHYIATQININGYTIYINGEARIDYASTDFDFTPIKDFLMEAPYFYLGYGDTRLKSETFFNDLKIYRNMITAKEIKTPTVKPPVLEDNYEFPPLNTVGYYLLDGSFTNLINPSQAGEFITVEAQANPSGFVSDATRGTVWNQQEGWTGHANGWGYTRFDNPLKGVQLTDEGLTLVLWLNPPVINWWDQIFVLNDGTSKFWLNALGYVGYNGVGGWFDCQQNNNSNEMTPGTWTMYTLVITPEEFTVYYNEEVKFTSSNNAAYNFADLADFQPVLNMFTSANDFFFGYESWWKAAPAMIDDLLFISRPVDEKEVKKIYQDTKRVNGGEVENPSYIPETAVGYYKLDNTFVNAKNASQGGEFITVEAQTTPSGFVSDATRGTVWNQQEGWTGHANGWAYTRFDNPMKGAQLADGFTLTLWLNPPVINWWDQIFVLNDGTSKFWLNALGYVGYNGVGGWFDCHNNNNANEMTPGVWTMYTVVFTAEEFIVYYNDEVKFTSSSNAGYNSADLADYQPVLNMFTSANDFFFGYESWWKAAPAMIDDVILCTSPLTEKQVKALYNGTKK